MRAAYGYAVDNSVLNTFSACNKRKREELLRIFKLLAESPHQKGDWLQKTASGRLLQVKRFGKWLVTYWSDDPALELRVVDVSEIILRL